jgi:hypothetical protein
MSIFKEACTEEKDHFITLCELTHIIPTFETIESLYSYIALLRTLPKPFYMTLDTSKSNTVAYLPHLSKIIKELVVYGQCRCLRMEIILHDRLGLVNVLQQIISKLTHEETQGCEILLVPSIQ